MFCIYILNLSNFSSLSFSVAKKNKNKILKIWSHEIKLFCKLVHHFYIYFLQSYRTKKIMNLSSFPEINVHLRKLMFTLGNLCSLPEPCVHFRKSVFISGNMCSRLEIYVHFLKSVFTSGNLC